jgi:rubrerythrin
MMDKKVVEFALDFEKQGAISYLELASSVGNPLSRNLFYTLAKQEIDHAKRIEEFYAGISVERPLKGADVTAVEEEIKSFFVKIKEKAAMPAETNLEVYKTAMELEKKGYQAYEKFYEESDDSGEKKFLDFLLKEEKSHLDSIANVYSYLSGTSDWLEKEESKTWNWMNT